MLYRYNLSKFRTLEYVLFFFAIVDNRYMGYSLVLYMIYLFRIMFAVKGYYLVIRSLFATGTTRYPELLLLQLSYSFAIISSGVINKHLSFGICFTLFNWIGITNYVLFTGITNIKILRTIDTILQSIMIGTLLLAIAVPDMMVTHSYDGSRIIEGFFGGKNALPPYILMGLSLNLMVHEIEKEKNLWRQYFYPLICVLLLLISGSGTGSVIAVVFLILYYTKVYKLLNVQNIIIIHTTLFFSIVVFKLQEKFLSSFIVDTLHKDITMTKRTDIWSIAINSIPSSWLLGHGLGNTVIARSLISAGWFMRQIVNETHNGILDITLSLGVMGLTLFLLLIIIILKKYDEYDNKTVSQAIKLYVFTYFVIAISESTFTLSRLSFWSMLFLGLTVQQAAVQKSKTF